MVSKTNNHFVILLCIALLGYFLYRLSPILTPFLIGMLLAYLADPFVNKLMHFRLSRLTSVIIVFLILFSVLITILLILIPLIQKQIVALAEMIPGVIAWIQNNILPWLQANMGLEEDTINIASLKTALADNWSKAGGFAGWVGKTVLHSGIGLLEWLMHLILVPVVTFYLLLDWNRIMHGLREMLPRHIEPTVVKLVKQCDEVLSAFFRGQLLVMLALGIVYSVGLTLAGLHVGLMIGLFAGLMSIVPYLGFITGIVAASIAAFIQDGSFTSVLLVWLVFGIGHILENVILVPRLIGNRIGLHPVAVIFAIMAGGTICGFFGVLVALPVAAVVMILINYLYKRYRNSKLYKNV